jgi:hypothetical protein
MTGFQLPIGSGVFCFTPRPDPLFGFTQHPIQWLPGNIPPRHSVKLIFHLRIMRLIMCDVLPLSPRHLHIMVLRNKDVTTYYGRRFMIVYECYLTVCLC